MARIAKLSEELTKADVLLASEGLLPSSHGARVVVTDGRVRVIDGPFVETKELVGGFAILRAKSKQEAIARRESGAGAAVNQAAASALVRAATRSAT